MPCFALQYPNRSNCPCRRGPIPHTMKILNSTTANGYVTILFINKRRKFITLVIYSATQQPSVDVLLFLHTNTNEICLNIYHQRLFSLN